MYGAHTLLQLNTVWRRGTAVRAAFTNVALHGKTRPQVQPGACPLERQPLVEAALTALLQGSIAKLVNCYSRTCNQYKQYPYAVCDRERATQCHYFATLQTFVVVSYITTSQV